MIDPSTNTTPCANLIEREPPECAAGREFPGDCAECPEYFPGISEQERTRCEIWSRVMGYHRPVSAWNAGKQQEHADRVLFREQSISL